MKKLLALSFGTISLLAQAQKADKSAVIFTVASQPVTVGEFEYVYTKNNINNQANYSEQSLNDYLKLYENFRLKVKEAEALHLDTISTLKTELEGYRKQLAKNYLTDREISDQLIQEAYDRSLKEVRAAHILVKCDENANPADTLAAYKKITDIRKRILKGEDFGKLAQELSDDPSAKQNKGDIGYFTVFQTVYPFESAVYTTKPGELSMPVRTMYGYHLVKVIADRAAQGEIHVAHILRKFPENATEAQKAETHRFIDSINALLTNGKVSFDEAVTAFSEDRTSKSKNGELPWFGTGRMVPEFEAAAFALKADGVVSSPVQTAYGWHIIKRLERKSLPTFSEVKNEYKKKVERDARSQVAKTKLLERIKKEYNFQESVANRKTFYALVDSSLERGLFKADSIKMPLNNYLFSFAGINFGSKDFAQFIEKYGRRRSDKSKEGLLNEYYDNFVTQKCMEYEESQLDKKKPEFASLLKEYRDGILLFELTDRKVWGYALKDTAGLEKFHAANKTKYMWGERADVEIFNCSDKKIADAARKMALKNKSAGDIQLKLNLTNAQSKVSVINGKYEKGQYDVVDKVEWKPGTTVVATLNDSSYQFIRVKAIVQPEPKSLKEAKGFVVSDYQEYLEKKWLAELRERYPIALNKEVFNSLIKK
jgi:peptidyl-prolyl cis-trans isomerase SurA